MRGQIEADILRQAHAGTGPAGTADADGRPAAAAAQASPAQGRQGPGDRGEELPVVPPMPPGSAEARTNSLWTCLTISRFRSVAK